MSERRIAVISVSTDLISDILGLPAGMTVRHLGLDPMSFALHVVVEHPDLPDTAPNTVPPELRVTYERQGDGVARLQYLGLGGGQPPLIDRESEPAPINLNGLERLAEAAKAARCSVHWCVHWPPHHGREHSIAHSRSCPCRPAALRESAIDWSFRPEPLRRSEADLSEAELYEMKEKFLAAQCGEGASLYWTDDGSAEGKPL